MQQMRRRGSLITSRGPRLELRPSALWDFTLQIAHFMRQAALLHRTRKALLGGADYARRTIADHQQRIRHAATPEELAAARGILFAAWRQMQQSLLAVRQNAQAASTASRG